MKNKGIFVLQKHHATHLHYDFRLEFNGVLKSWALPKGLSRSTKDRRLGIETMDHPLEYATFEGKIPKGQYGAGKVKLWDKGEYMNIRCGKEGKLVSLAQCFKEGHLEIWIQGSRFQGGYALIRLKEAQWLFIKMDDKKLLEK
ncbi:MAG: DNA polymerase ligase N-terminal domain-containing protein [Chlamydiota bacterium]